MKKIGLTVIVLLFALISIQANAFAAVTFGDSGLDASGFQPVVAADPLHQGVLLSGADVAGFNRSADSGDTWGLSNGGISDRQLMPVAAIAFSQQTPNKVYGALGKANQNGGFVVSTDGGNSWEVRSTQVKFAGEHADSKDPVPSNHPRPQGNLIALDEANGYIYAGTYDDGFSAPATMDTLGPILDCRENSSAVSR